jgi:hypothetical protein
MASRLIRSPAATLAWMTLIAVILLVVLLVALPVAIVGSLFVWGSTHGRRGGQSPPASARHSPPDPARALSELSRMAVAG